MHVPSTIRYSYFAIIKQLNRKVFILFNLHPSIRLRVLLRQPPIGVDRPASLQHRDLLLLGQRAIRLYIYAALRNLPDILPVADITINLNAMFSFQRHPLLLDVMYHGSRSDEVST